MTSAPRLLPQPNCVPWESFHRWSVPKELTHFEHFWRWVFPTAKWSSSAVLLAPRKKVSNLQGCCPLRHYLVHLLASGGTRSLPLGSLLSAIRSLYSRGRSRVGPSEDSRGKNLSAFATVGSNVIKLTSKT